MDPEIRDSILKAGPHWYHPRSLGNNLEIDDEDRERLQAWTIEAWNISKEQRKVLNLEKRRKAEERRRRKAGAKSQAESDMRTKPWEADGISRATYYRRKQRETGSWPPTLSIRQGLETVSSGETTSCTETLLSAPSQPSAGSSTQRRVVSLSDYLAEKKALALATRQPLQRHGRSRMTVESR
jgi:hypothetical protein